MIHACQLSNVHLAAGSVDVELHAGSSAQEVVFVEKMVSGYVMKSCKFAVGKEHVTARPARAGWCGFECFRKIKVSLDKDVILIKGIA